jgi:NitT/TauT family transport system substrate-binding protein
MRLKRRHILGAVLAAPVIARGEEPARTRIRASLTGPGGAGAVWAPLIAGLPPSALAGIDLQWIGASPGQMQMQLVAGSIDVGVFGGLGLTEMAARGSDIVIFGPALNNHGRWLVKADSPYQKPEDLIGKRLAALSETSETFKQARIASAVAGFDMREKMSIVFGPPVANEALFERGDVDGIVTIEPTATRLVGRGAREIARVGDIWQRGTGEKETPFLVGLAAQRRWVDQNRPAAAQLARAFIAANALLQQEPRRLSDLHTYLGIPDAETAAIALLPERNKDVYSTAWNDAVFASIDRQIDVALHLGLVSQRSARPLYDRTLLSEA